MGSTGSMGSAGRSQKNVSRWRPGLSMARMSSKESNTSSRLSSRVAELMISMMIAVHISDTSLLALSAALSAASACVGRVKLWCKSIDLHRVSLAVEGGRNGWTKNRPFLDLNRAV